MRILPRSSYSCQPHAVTPGGCTARPAHFSAGTPAGPYSPTMSPTMSTALGARPNILLITTDTSRCDTLGAYGSPSAVSPHLDRLAREGVVFDQAHTPAPVCM